MYDSDIMTSDEDEPMVVMMQYPVDIEGIKVHMPVKPYPCQRMVMKAIIDGCNTQQHCLIESPTGSGKTLALLCGSLGWTVDYRKKIGIELEKREREYQAAKINVLIKGEKVNDGKLDNEDLVEFDDEDWADDAFLNHEPAPVLAVPKVFYCSRTHKQLDQVVSELRKTAYGQTRMTVLSSREFTCIQDSNMNKTKLCNELLDPSKKMGCRYYTEDNKTALTSFHGLKKFGVKSPWDIEDLVRAGKAANACPYFAARGLMAEADLILCPYNYIIDETIRESMQIDVTGSVIILDEAHNIEDVCREAGSVSTSISQLETIIANCTGIVKETAKKHHYEISYAGKIRKYCEDLSRFILQAELKQESYETYSISRWTGPEFVAALQKYVSVTSQASDAFINAVREATVAKITEKEVLRMNLNNPKPALDGDNVRYLEKIAWALKMITSEKFANDYRMFIKQSSFNSNVEISLEFMCMNPAVIFAPLCKRTRSVILASGTLAPMSSYQGELGVQFPYVVQAEHVTPREQVLIKCIESNSVGNPLKATFQTTNTSEFQDDIGKLVLTACRAIPHGILVFLSSYNVMEKLCNRWQSNDMWNQMSKMKEIFQETRGSGDITSMMDSYREAIRSTAEKPAGGVTGALLFAVYRGKVAEGIDFSDNEARCVLTIGIPYAVRHSPATDLKCRYNDLNRNKGLLGGSEWYTVNAFKGLNQALGRAIRHQNDWAAILMVDARILEPRHTNLLPKWVKSMWITETERDSDLRSLLNRFVARQIRRVASTANKNPMKRECDTLYNGSPCKR